MVTLSFIFSEFVGTFFHNVVPLTEILYLDLLNSNGGILLKLDVEKFVGYLGVGLQNLFQKIFGAVEI